MTASEFSRERRWLRPAAGWVGAVGLAVACSGFVRSSGYFTVSSEDPAPEYLDSRVCQTCHAEIYQSYQEVAMARSFYRPSPKNVIEDYTHESHFYHAPSNRHYRMVQRDGRFYQKRYQLDAEGKEKNVLEREVTHIIGSGEHARSYLNLDDHGVLRQLPVTWYPQIQRWGMSPGYDHARHEDFSRRITHSCMFCHNGYPQVPEPSDRYGQRSVFTRDLPSGIGCHRCHGSGSHHLRLASSGKASKDEIRQAIVNPARLSPRRQLDVCLQCHLEAASAAPRFRRSGRPVYSFRPGESLTDYIVHFDLIDPAGGSPSDRFEIDGAGYRLRQSPCFRMSRGAMTCTTCHDPHRKLRREEGVRHYRERCMNCHARPSAAVHGDRPVSDCASCHMPRRRTEDVVHVVMTDHLIQRRPPERELLAPLQEDHSLKEDHPVLYFPESLSSWESDLYQGMAQVQSPGSLRQGLARLAAALEQKSAPFAEPYVKLAMAQAGTGQLDEARISLRRALKIDPNSAIGHFNLAEVMRRQGRMAAAAQEYRKTLAIDPDYAKAHHGLGLISRQKGERAIEFFQQALRSDPLLAQAHLNLGRIYLDQGKATQASKHFRKALQIEPDSAETHLNMGLSQARLGRRGNALEAFRQAVALNPGSPEAHYNLGLALAQMGRKQEALEAFRQAVRLKPDDAEAHSNLGVAYSELGRLEAAVGAFQQAVRIMPTSARAYFNLGLTQARLGRSQEAIEALSRSVRLAPQDAEIRLNLGLIHLSVGDRAAALRQYQVIRDLDRERSQVLFDRISRRESAVSP